MLRRALFAVALGASIACGGLLGSDFEEDPPPAVTPTDSGPEASSDANDEPDFDDGGSADAKESGPSDGASDAKKGDADAGPCSACPHKVFVTSSTIGAMFGDPPTQADAYCETVANGVGSEVQGRKWRAWLSTSTKNARDRISNITGSWVRPDGTMIASSTFALVVGPLDAPISVNELGLSQSGSVWTGSDSTGIYASGATCNDWKTASTGFAMVGNSAESDAGWSNSGFLGCDQKLHLYCFEF